MSRAEYVARLLAVAPPLNVEQISKLTVLLRRGGVSK